MSHTCRSWEDNFQALLRYKEEHGHCLVPEDYEADKALGSWARQQRRNRDKLPPQYLKKLLDVGFSFNLAKVRSNKLWYDSYKQLKTYRSEHGDCVVPQHYPKNQKLANWVQKQRRCYTLGELDADRIEKLESIGFVWRLQAAPLNIDTTQQDRTWELNYENLLKFKENFGHCIVPVVYDKALSLWARRQRHMNTKNQLKPERKRLLDDVCFEWRINGHIARKAKIRMGLVATDGKELTKGPELSCHAARVGTKVLMEFGSGEADGVVTSEGSVASTWHIQYTNGQEEVVTETELDVMAQMYKERYFPERAKGKENTWPSEEVGDLSDRRLSSLSLAQTIYDEDQHVGSRVRKVVDMGYCSCNLDGVVIRKTKKGQWRIRYSDGTKESITKRELLEMVAAHKDYEKNGSSQSFSKSPKVDKVAPKVPRKEDSPKTFKPVDTIVTNASTLSSLSSLSAASDVPEPNGQDMTLMQVPRKIVSTKMKRLSTIPPTAYSTVSSEGSSVFNLARISGRSQTTTTKGKGPSVSNQAPVGKAQRAFFSTSGHSNATRDEPSKILGPIPRKKAPRDATTRGIRAIISTTGSSEAWINKDKDSAVPLGRVPRKNMNVPKVGNLQASGTVSTGQEKRKKSPSLAAFMPRGSSKTKTPLLAGSNQAVADATIGGIVPTQVTRKKPLDIRKGPPKANQKDTTTSTSNSSEQTFRKRSLVPTSNNEDRNGAATVSPGVSLSSSATTPNASVSGSGDTSASAFSDAASGTQQDAYQMLFPVFMELCKKINENEEIRQYLPKYEERLNKWIGKIDERSNKRRRIL